jgi:cell division transport system permease protein
LKIGSYLRSAFAQAGAGVRAAPLLPSVTVLAVALGLALVGTVHVVSRNAAALLESLGNSAQLTVYFDPEAPPGRTSAAAEALRRIRGVDHVRFVTAAEAMQRLRRGMGARAALLDGLEDDFLQPSLEVSFATRVDADFLSALAARVKQMPAVEDVDTMGDWVARLRGAADFLRIASLAALIGVALGCLYLVGATIKLAVFARREEIEILRLVGATPRYVHAPFWIEGSATGLLGGALGLGVLYGLFRALAPRAEHLLGGVLGGVHLVFPRVGELLPLVAVTGAVGLLGAHLAVRRHLHA